MNGRVATGAAALIASLGVLGVAGAVATATNTTAHKAVHKHKTAANAAAATSPHPAVPHIRLYVPDAFFVNHQPVTLPTLTVHVGGVVHPYVAGQWVTIKAYQNGRVIRTETLRLQPSRHYTYGHFTANVAAPGHGTVTVWVRHQRNQAMQGFLVSRSYQALDENVGFGASGPFVQLLQRWLSDLHFYIPQTGVYDQGTGLAIDAYHRLLGWGTSQTLDARTVWFLFQHRGQFTVRFPSQGAHAEGDLTNQLLALINGSKVYWIFPISSGKPSTPTILGSFQVYYRVPGYLPDGMYYSSFFTGGYAIHGYDPAPDYPASHGCMRLPIVDAIPAYNWLNMGDWVDTYF